MCPGPLRGNGAPHWSIHKPETSPKCKSFGGVLFTSTIFQVRNVYFKGVFMKKSVVFLSVVLGMPLLGCATQESNRKVSSDGHVQVEEKQVQVCSEYERKTENGTCERLYKGDRPMRRGGL